MSDDGEGQSKITKLDLTGGKWGYQLATSDDVIASSDDVINGSDDVMGKEWFGMSNQTERNTLSVRIGQVTIPGIGIGWHGDKHTCKLICSRVNPELGDQARNDLKVDVSTD